MFIDEDDKIYVADQYNRRINIYQYMGERYKGTKEKTVEINTNTPHPYPLSP